MKFILLKDVKTQGFVASEKYICHRLKFENLIKLLPNTQTEINTEDGKDNLNGEPD